MKIDEWLTERERIHAAANKGPWCWEGESEDDWPQSDNSLMAGGEAVVVGWGYDASGINVEDNDALAITDALNNLPRLLSAVQAVLALHVPKTEY